MANRIGIDSSEIREAVRRLNEIPGYIDKERKNLLKYAAEPFLEAAKRNVPKSGQTHKRYKNGVVVAEYKPGNLRRSLRFLPFRRTKSVFIGPVLQKSGRAGVDGYYAHFVEYGTVHSPAKPYMRPAFVEQEGNVLQRMRLVLSKRVKSWQTKYDRR